MNCLPGCPLCAIDRVPVVPGKELPLRRSHPPYGVDPAAHYAGPIPADSVRTMPEFIAEHRAPATHPIARLLLIAVAVVVLIVATAVVALADPVTTPPGDPQEPPRPAMSPAVTLPPQGPPSNDD